MLEFHVLIHSCISSSPILPSLFIPYELQVDSFIPGSESLPLLPPLPAAAISVLVLFPSTL